MTVSNPFQDEGLTVLTVSDRDFSPALDILLSQPAKAKAGSVLPHSLILVNNTGKYIWGFTVLYLFPQRIAPSGKPWRYFVTPAAKSSDRRLMLAPGAKYWIAPISGLEASTDANGKRSLEPILDEGLDRMIEGFSKQEAKEPIEVAIDSIISEDGTIIGPDTVGRAQQINDEIRADKEVLDSIENLQGDALRKQLDLWIALRGTDRYTVYRFGRANFFKAVLDHQGEAKLMTIIQDAKTRQWFIGSDAVKTNKGRSTR